MSELYFDYLEMFSSRSQSPVSSTTQRRLKRSPKSVVFIPFTKSGQFNVKLSLNIPVMLTFSSRSQSPVSSTCFLRLKPKNMGSFHPVHKVRSVQPYPRKPLKTLGSQRRFRGKACTIIQERLVWGQIRHFFQ